MEAVSVILVPSVIRDENVLEIVLSDWLYDNQEESLLQKNNIFNKLLLSFTDSRPSFSIILFLDAHFGTPMTTKHT